LAAVRGRDQHVSVVARIYVDASARDLAAALADAECFTVLRDERTIDVVLPFGVAQGRVELAFFLNAWRVDHPHVELRLAC
jgi:hypothetical protein